MAAAAAVDWRVGGEEITRIQTRAVMEQKKEGGTTQAAVASAAWATTMTTTMTTPRAPATAATRPSQPWTTQQWAAASAASAVVPTPTPQLLPMAAALVMQLWALPRTAGRRGASGGSTAAVSALFKPVGAPAATGGRALNAQEALERVLAPGSTKPKIAAKAPRSGLVKCTNAAVLMQMTGSVSVVPVAAASARRVQAEAPEALRVLLLRQLRQTIQETDPAVAEADTSSADIAEKPAPSATCADSVMAQVKAIMARLIEIGGHDVEHPDAATQKKLRKEYRQLEQQLDACLSSDDYAEELKREALAWEETNAAANEQALRAVRRCLPVQVRVMSEAGLKSTKSPTGRLLPPAMARRFKRATVLGLLRTSPATITQMHPSAIVHLNCIGLNLTERRALHAHLRQPAQSWKASPRSDLTQKKIDWFSGLECELKRAVASYNEHVERNGAADNQADTRVLYDEDLGWPEGEVYADAASSVKCGLPVDETQHYQVR